jgi:threonine dehydratase
MGIDDRPGSLAALLGMIAATGANVLDVTHSRQSLHVPLRGVEVRLLLETRDSAHIDELSSRMVEMGYVPVEGDEAFALTFRPRGWPTG